MTERKLRQLKTEAQEWLRTDHNGFTLDSLVDLILKFAEPRDNCVTEPMEQYFKKEAKKWVKENSRIEHSASFGEIAVEPSAEKGFQDGAEFGYNKANEWHYVKDGLPDEGIYLVVWQNDKGYKEIFILKYEEDDEEELHWVDDDYEVQDEYVIAWKEIIFPKGEWMK